MCSLEYIKIIKFPAVLYKYVWALRVNSIFSNQKQNPFLDQDQQQIFLFFLHIFFHKSLMKIDNIQM